MAKGAAFLCACSFGFVTILVLHTASGQIGPLEAPLRPARPVPKADSIPKPMYIDESAEETAQREAVERALAKNVDIAFDDTPLSEFEKRLGEISGLKVELDHRALTDAGIALDIKVTLSLRQISLRSALKILLRKVDVTFFVQDGALLITSPDKASSVLRTVIFPVADLIDGFDESGRRIKDYESVFELITSHAAPTTWDAVGGSGNVKEFDGSIIVAQTPEVISQIEALLRTIRVAREQQSKGDFSHLRSDPESENTLRIRKALEAKVTLECRATPLSKLAEMIAIESGVNVLLDENALVDSGIELDTKVDGVAKNMPLSDALKKLLRDLDLSYAMRDEVLYLTTRDRTDYTAYETRIYPLDDLYRGSFDDERTGFGDQIVELVARCIGPTTWDNVGGFGNLYFADTWNLLVVSNTPEIHQQVPDLLEKLRAMREKQDRSALIHDEIETRVYRIGPPEVAKTAAKETEVQLKGSEVHFDAKELATAIRELIEPDSWKEAGVDLRILSDRVVVRHRRSIQAKVRQFLTDLHSPERIGTVGGGSEGRF